MIRAIRGYDEYHPTGVLQRASTGENMVGAILKSPSIRTEVFNMVSLLKLSKNKYKGQT